MHWRSLWSLVLVAPYADALLRLPCSQLVTERFDPLVNPGAVSPHLHQIIGGDAFNISMATSNDLPTLSTCTTCRFAEDFSNYWTAVIFFKHPNGSYIRVPQMANQYVGSPNGGMTVYYIQPPDNSKVTAFKPGFRMLVGNAMARNRTLDPNTAASQALTFRCFSENFGGNDGAPGAGPNDSQGFPTKPCAGGIRANIYFPSCWDGITLDPPDHQSHMAYPVGAPPAGGLFFMQGTCPSTHPVRTPLIFMETVWDTRDLNKMWPTDGSQPLVFSMGDPTGYGQHADYVFGWKGDALQNAMNTCTDISGVPSGCSALTLRTDDQMNQCLQAARVPEQTEGYLPALPGCNPIQPGPAQATGVQGCTAVSTTGPAPAPPTPTSGSPTIVIPSPVPTSPPSPTSPAGAQQTHYGQCGGSGYSGPTSCQSPYTCKVSNQWYSQCL